MIQVLAQMRDGRFVQSRTDEIDASALAKWPECVVQGRFPDECAVAWFDVQSPSARELAWLGERFHFHPLALEDCAHFDQRPKIEEYTNHLFVVVHGLKANGDAECLSIYELHSFLAKGLVVTVHDGPVEPLRTLWERMSRDRNHLPTQEDLLLHKILDAVMDANPQALIPIEEEIEALDEEVLENPQTAHVEKIHVLQRQLALARRVLGPQREILQDLIQRRYEGITERAAPYFRDIYDHLIQVSGDVEELRESLWSIRDTYLEVAAYRTNEAMKRLTVFSVVFLPLTFITGFFGMNFTHIPFENELLLFLTVILVVTLPLGMLIWFNKKNWI